MGVVDAGQPLRFAIPEGPAIALELPARLESWDRHDHPSQVALREWVAHVRERIDPLIEGQDGPLALRVDVGLRETVDPLWQRDLDNYLYPIARELPERVVSVWGTKTRRAHSSVRIEPARPSAGDSGADWQQFKVEPASSESGWKEAVYAAVADARELPPGPVGLEVAFTLGQDRQWPAVWKPTIDGLDPLLGRTYADREWNPQDGRIVRIGLHRRLGPDLGRRVGAIIRAGAAPTTWSELSWLGEFSQAQLSDYMAEHKSRLGRALGSYPTVNRSVTAMKVLSDEPGVSVFIDDDEGYGRWLVGASNGFVINAPRSGRGDLVIHNARCHTINGTPPRGDTWTGPYIKACAASTAALDRWAVANAGSRPRPCGTCAPI